jgi:hypothetical protein
MSIRELTCPDHGHPVGPDDAYCGICGAAVQIPSDPSRRPWPMLVPDEEPTLAGITPIRPEVDFKPLDLTQARADTRRRAMPLALAVLATLACGSLLAVSEITLGEGGNWDLWVVMWLTSYAATVIAVTGWLSLLFRWARTPDSRQAQPA